MEQASPFETLLICGVPVLQWRFGAEPSALTACRRLLDTLAKHGYRELVFDLQTLGVRSPRELQRLLSGLEKLLPAPTRAEIVLPAGIEPARHPRRMHVAPSLALALSHITRLPVASLQGMMATHVHWHELQG